MAGIWEIYDWKIWLEYGWKWLKYGWKAGMWLDG